MRLVEITVSKIFLSLKGEQQIAMTLKEIALFQVSYLDRLKTLLNPEKPPLNPTELDII